MWWIIGAIAICVCIGLAEANKKEEEQKQIAANNTVAAKQPEALVRFLKEEFPDFSASFTFSRAQEALRTYDTTIKSKECRKHWNFMGNQIKSKEDEYAVARIISGTVAKSFSEDFRNFAHQNPYEFYIGFNRALNASYTIANT